MTLMIHVPDWRKVLEEIPNSFTQGDIQEYLDGDRHDVLDNTDIFCENVRSVNIREKQFDRFHRTTAELANVIVFPVYLELFEFLGKQDSIPFAIEHWCNKHKDKTVVFFWNHDVDFARYNQHVVFQPNCRVINYNTSEKTPNDIVVPFWTMQNIESIDEKKTTFCSFMGNLTHPVRNSLYGQLIQNSTDSEDYQFHYNLPYEEYRKKLAQTTYSLCPRGAGLSSYRFFECIHANTTPVLIADDVVLPYEEEVDYDTFIIRYREENAGSLSMLDDVLVDSFWSSEEMVQNMKKVRHKFTLAGVQDYVYRRLIR